MKYVAGSLAVFLIWNLVAGSFLLLIEPPLGLPVALVLSGVLLKFHLLQPWGGETRARRWATLRLRPLSGATLHWTLLTIPVLLVLAWSLGDVYTRLVPVPAESLDPFESVMRTPGGRLTIAVFAIAVAPLVEEFVFRGLVQRTLERQFGAAIGITASAALFALIHFLPWIFPLHFILGMAFGLAVYATRSIWTGVILHAANNAVALMGGVLSRGDPEPTGSIWEVGPTPELWISLCALTVAALLSIQLGRRLFAAGRAPRLRPF